MFAYIKRYFLSEHLYGAIPKMTLVEQKRKAWGDNDPAFRTTANADQRKQWRPLQIVPKRRRA